MFGTEKNRAKPALWSISIVCWLSVGFALFTQHIWDMQPCPWCIIQRMVYVAIALLAMAGALAPVRARSSLPQMVLWACMILAIVGLGVALYQAIVGSSQVSCDLTLAQKIIMASGLDELLPEIFKPRASCVDAAKSKLLGLPYEVVSGALFAILAGFGWRSAARRN